MLPQLKIKKKIIYNLAKEYGGVKGDATNGRRGYDLTFMIAYLRDLAFNCGHISESFETSVSWSNALSLCLRVKTSLKKKKRANF